MSSDGNWVVDLVKLAATGNGRDGDCSASLTVGFSSAKLATGMALPGLGATCGRHQAALQRPFARPSKHWVLNG